MAIIVSRAWYLQEYEPVPELEKRPHDLRISKSSLLKSALRADFLDDIATVKQSPWFQRYLAGEEINFYIEGSGGYAIANIDLISHEIYFTKREIMAHLEPVIFLCYQTAYSNSSDCLRQELHQFVEQFNQRSRLPLRVEESHRLTDGPARLNSTLVRKIRQSLLFIADGTPIAQIDGSPALLIPSPQVCVEMGYALHSKKTEQILLAQMQRSDIVGQFPFDLPSSQRLLFKDAADLHKQLPKVIDTQLQQFNLQV